jgi:tight adherence protein B
MSVWLAALALAAAVVLSARHRPAGRISGWVRRDSAVPDGFVTDSAAATNPASSRPSVIAWTALALAVSVTVVAVRLPLPLVVGTGVMGLAGERWRRWRLEAVACEGRSTASVEVTFALAGELRAGRTPAQALAAVAPMAGPLRAGIAAAGAAVEVGGDAAAELARTADLPGAERLRYVAAAWSVAESAGGRIAVVLERLCDSMDADDELRRELDAAMAGPRATMVMLGFLPVLGLVLGQAVGARPVHLLLHRPVGWALLFAAAALDGAGIIATRAIARIALRL